MDLLKTICATIFLVLYFGFNIWITLDFYRNTPRHHQKKICIALLYMSAFWIVVVIAAIELVQKTIRYLRKRTRKYI